MTCGPQPTPLLPIVLRAHSFKWVKAGTEARKTEKLSSVSERHHPEAGGMS